MKWIGQHIVDFIARFRSDVYMENISDGTVADDKFLGLDSNGKIVKEDVRAVSGVGDITGVTITTDSGGGSAASDTGGSADFSILGDTGVNVTNSGTTITATAVPGEIDHDSLQNFLAAEHYDWSSDISGTATINAANIPTLNQNTTGSAATLTTPRAINGVNFDGSAPITVTAAGSTLSDTVTVAKGGTGTTSLTDGGILLGSGSSAITAMSVLGDGEMIVGDGTTDPVAESGATLRASIGCDAAGTDNSTAVTLGTGSHDYLSISTQEITLGAIDLAADVTGVLPHANIGNDAIDGDNIADDVINSEHYVAASIDNEHLADNAVDTDEIADDAVTYAKIQDVSATNKILGRDSAGAGVIEEITPANLRTMINVEDGADVTDTANVTSAGALMDTEVDADIKTLSLPASTTISTYGASLVDDADAAAARTTLGLGTGAVLDTAAVADNATTLATGDQIHAFVTTSVSTLLTSLATSVQDVLSLSTQTIGATDPGDADALAGWDHSENKFTYLSAGDSRTALGLGTSAVLDTALIADGGAGVATADQIHTFVTTQTDAMDADTSGQAGTVATIAGLAPNTATTQATQAAITTCANLTTVGALASGTIASGFGNIDNGASTLDTGAATLASLTCTAAATFGGGYGSTGATISTAGAGQFNGALNTDSTFACVGGAAIAGNSSGGGFIKFHEDTDNGVNFMALRAPEAVTTNTTLLLPDGDGAANARLKTDGAGNLSWANETIHTVSGANAGDVGDGAEIVYFGSGTVIAGLIYYYKDDGSWEITNANAAATSTGLLGVALGGGTASTVGMCIRGMVNLLTDSTGGVGDVLWLEDATNGRADNVAPAGNGDIARVIGYCLSGDGRRIFFNPDNTFVEVTA